VARGGTGGHPGLGATVTGARGGPGVVVVASVVGAAVEAGGGLVVVVSPDWRTRLWRAPPPLHEAQTAASATSVSSLRTGPWWRNYGPAVARLVPTCVWRISPDLVLALQDRFGDPVDAYVNGSQVWLRDDGPGDVTLEYRLHPVAGYARPDGVDTYDVFTATAQALAQSASAPVPVERLWDGLEAFAAYGDELEPATLSAATTAALGRPPDACGLADHERIGDDWEKSQGATSIVDALLNQLSG
jgi:hypothetical protein